MLRLESCGRVPAMWKREHAGSRSVERAAPSPAVRALADAVQRQTVARGGAGAFATPVDGLTLHRADDARRPGYRVFKPALCVVAQGAKEAIVGDRRLAYRAGQALVASVAVPGVGRVTEAGPGRPYLGVILELDPGLMREVLEGLTGDRITGDRITGDGLHGRVARKAGPAGPGHGGPVDPRAAVFVADVDGPLADRVVRLVQLLDTPAAIPTLRPLIVRELCYWLLAGPHGGAIARMALGGPHPAPSSGRCTCCASTSPSRSGSATWRGSRR